MTLQREKSRVVVIDDDPILRESLKRFLKTADTDVDVFEDAETALLEMDDGVEVVLLDLFLPGQHGLQCLKLLRRQYPETRVIVVSSSTDHRDIVDAIQGGAEDFLQKPVDAASVIQAVIRAQNAGQHSNHAPDSESTSSRTTLLGAEFTQALDRAASLNSTVMLLGESGTGKSAAAGWIHDHSSRARSDLISLNCASLPVELAESELFGHVRGAFTGADRNRPGKVELAHKGTLFLDEVGDLPPSVQPKLLTFLQNREASRVGSNELYSSDVRIIVATHRDLVSMCDEGLFREDLFYRLNVLPLTLRPLRERLSEISALSEMLLHRIADRFGCRPPALRSDAIAELQRHKWPGNIRELENVLERATAFIDGDEISAGDIRFSRVPGRTAVRSQTPTFRTLDAVEKDTIERALARCGGNKALTARKLGICERSIYNKIKRYGIITDQTESNKVSDSD